MSTLFLIPPRKVAASPAPINGSNLQIEGEAIGDMVVYTGTTWVRLPLGGVGQFLVAGSTAPTYRLLNAGDLPANTVLSDSSQTITGAKTFSGTFTLTGLSGVLKASGGVVAGSGGLSDLANVVITSPSDGQVLQFSSGSSTWVNITPGTGGTVTSITAGFGLTGGTISVSGTIAVDLSATYAWTGSHSFTQAITFASGQTFNATHISIASQALGDLLYASSGSAWARLGIGTSGYVLTVSGGVPTWAPATGGGGGIGITWNSITTNASMTSNNGYIVNGGSLTLSLPATASTNVGDVLEVVGASGSWEVTQASGQQIYMGTGVHSTSGTGGSVTSTEARDCVRMVAVTTSQWQIVSSYGAPSFS